ncbi:eukaryotic translation initiation factor eif-1 [Fusarium flagelliforme]|uniref:Eukaryotic translation initiation factor eif-1 n=4 Tax=Fusarium TaxID=5506 RepID=A0A395MA39_9HYPO|nr:eukaryotic translation initiation factor eif-1 [Fusarium flagelliforme]
MVIAQKSERARTALTVLPPRAGLPPKQSLKDLLIFAPPPSTKLPPLSSPYNVTNTNTRNSQRLCTSQIVARHIHRSSSTLQAVAEHILNPFTKPISQGHPSTSEFMSIENLKTYDPFAEADEDTGETKQTQNYIHIRIQQRNGRKTLTTVQGLPKKFDQKKILKVIKKKFACNGTIVNDSEMGEVIQLQGDQRKDVQEFLVDKKEGLELDAKTIKVHGF